MSAITIGIRHPGGTKRLTVQPTMTLKALKEMISKEINEPVKDMKLFGPGRQEHVGEASMLNKLGINQGDLVIVDVPLPPAAAVVPAPVSKPATPVTPASAAAAAAAAEPVVAKTCACRGKQRCLLCMPQVKVDTGYGDRARPEALTSDPGDLRTASCKHGPKERCLNCRPEVAGAGTGFIPFLCKHGPGQKCSNCVTVSREEVLAAQRIAQAAAAPASAPLPCNHPPGGKCINCMDKTDVDVYDTEYDPRKHCRHHGPHGSCTECVAVLEKMKPTIRSQDVAVCKRVDVSRAAARAFGQFILDTAFSLQRVGVLYGTVTDENVVRVEAVYEPPQVGAADGAEFSQDPEATRVDGVAASFGWKRVGWVFSHAAREIHMTAREVVQAARFQLEMGPTAVTLVCLPEGGGQFRYEAYQASDQAVQLLSRGWLADQQNQPDAVSLSATRTVLLAARAVPIVPTLYLITNVPIVQHDGSLRHDFPVENRPHGQTLADYTSYMTRLRTKPFVERVEDFHLLLFLSQLLSPADAHSLCEAVKTRNASRAEGFKYVINDLLGVSD